MGVWGESTGERELCLNKLTWAWLGFLLWVKEQENTLTFASLKMEGQACDTMTEESLACSFFPLILFTGFSFYLFLFFFSPVLSFSCFCRPPSTLPSQSPPLNPTDRSHKKPFVSTSGCWHESRKQHEKCAPFFLSCSYLLITKVRKRKKETEEKEGEQNEWKSERGIKSRD